jgi:hypothetical protein
MITDPDLWIADTAASAHTTPYDNSMTEQRPGNRTIAMGNGTVDETAVTGSVYVTVMDKEVQTKPISYLK